MAITKGAIAAPGSRLRVRPARKPHIDGIPVTVAFVHAPPRAANPKHMKHVVEKKQLSLAGRAQRPR